MASSLSRSDPSFADLLKLLANTPGKFDAPATTRAFELITARESAVPATQLSAFLTALKAYGLDRRSDIIAASAQVLRSRALAIVLAQSNELDESPICDIVGTGGDGHNTFNVSTSAALVAAGAGCRVCKHGNRAASSSSGSADILLSAGAPITELPATALASLTSSFIFLFAPLYHPAMVRVAPVRRELGFSTIFNILGPLVNPARPECMIVGVHSRYLGEQFVRALASLSVRRAWVVCGAEGLDEISPAGETHVWSLHGGAIQEQTIAPADFGLTAHSLEAVRGGTPAENAVILSALLQGELAPSDAIENFVVMNAAALIMLAGRANTLLEGVSLARESIRSGRAKRALDDFVSQARHAIERAA
ncbi:uncharacterized protein L969DRAFT_96570 [Mixia osmundae IAM 14324]|uniref:Anthranilate phosphoribosyltransferase n=1 Tax=Mixia osmundae (strain CBS 9802 / IAM 14324 / JCM 22182 / KY 12970) TaxID=764103 RepID=G7EAU4_MIXOS|nr:uncharacterized protein L969DRAFT_96570 [Mixia osmundae IAM 14324]KEI36988.1 hypothetical protein L969DRAFT_96570 [Mixia osmundae IAM 14324]GAA99954.1 hypothetical protein E5Q_06657 [Mixia osmundae IAM 14324]